MESELYDVGHPEKDRTPAETLLRLGSFQYSHEFRERIVGQLRGMEGFPNYSKYVSNQLGGPESRLMQFVRYLCPEIEYRCGRLRDMKVLDFGCGNGASTTALALHSKSVIGFDIDREAIEINRMRLAEHGLESRVQLYSASSIEEVKDQIGSVDLVLLCGVIEHLPGSDAGLRRQTIRTLFGMLNGPGNHATVNEDEKGHFEVSAENGRGGFMYVYDTPNRLWPYDFHTTGLWWIPWTKPGSARAYERAVRRGRFMEAPRFSPGPQGLEQCGAWGATYWEIVDYLKGESYRCMNTLPGNNKHIDYLGGARRYRLVRYPFDFFVGLMARPLRIPITAFYPFLDNLVLMKTGTRTGS